MSHIFIIWKEQSFKFEIGDLISKLEARYLVRKHMDINEHERPANITFRNKLK